MEQGEQEVTSHERDVTSLVALRPFFTGEILSDITPWLIEKYKKERKDQRKSNQTINLELACLKTLFSKAMLWGKATENPVKHVKMLKVNNAHVRFLEEEEEERLAPGCKEHFFTTPRLLPFFQESKRPCKVSYMEGWLSG